MIDSTFVIQILTLIFSFVSGFLLPLFKLYRKKVKKSSCITCCSSCMIEEETTFNK